ncbi:uncharacterized protein BDZ99DRAFT_504116 [Mytilinidion resinicola]|uniref:Pentatricopeptide repeat protein n=1 Tax=Mytilinidion resinicola TaxID=574789 RepID=A0A6A6Y274_9PEZI|nr:uncharacterized protein BDZ99DRAFT_504116 [Mytilinidion resinicola]KAF2802104.1 hypothetical protein BDZ99DRAFT_504116 [Mytilinidion resinicola]
MPPRLSLSSCICPSAPFLLPVTARIALRGSQRHLQPWVMSSTYARTVTTPAKEGYSKSESKQDRSKPKTKHIPSRFLNQQKGDNVARRPLGLPEPVRLFREQIYARDLDKAMEMLPGLAANNLMTPHNTLLITALLHNTARTLHRDLLRKNIEKYLSYVRILVHHIQNRSIPPHHAALVHLISFFKVAGHWQEGIDLWTWCRAQDETYVDASVYGAAIEMLAYHGTMSLEELEELYQEGLTRFPSTFAEYHMSPEAVVLDRTQLTTIAGLPMTLLQGILTARLVHGDWKNAYLALDVAFRLYPTQVPPRIFEIFFYERPLSEAFTVTLMAARSGVILRPGHLSALQTRLNGANWYNTAEEQILTIQSSVVAMQASLGGGGSLHNMHLSNLIKGFEVLLPSRFKNADDAQDAEVRDCVISTVQKIVANFNDAGVAMSRVVLCTLIGLYGKARASEAIGSMIAEMTAREIEHDEISCRVLVSAFGDAGDAKSVESCWEMLVAFAESKGKQVSEADWRTLARAIKFAKNTTFLEKQYEHLSHTLTTDIKEAITRELEKERTLPEKKGMPMDAAAMAPGMESIYNRVSQLLALFKSGSLLDFKLSPTPLFIDPARPALGSVEDLRAIYDELTTDPRQPPPGDSTVSKPLSPTGFPLDELRFQNWVTILEAMSDAEAYETEKAKLIDEAIDSGNPLPEKLHAPLYRKSSITETDVMFTSREELRRHILRLRGIHRTQIA